MTPTAPPVSGHHRLNGRVRALLLRQRLEAAVDSWWTRRAPDMTSASWNSKFVAMVAGRRDEYAWVHQLWCELSSAGHVRGYELSPTSAEIESWRQRVDQAVAHLAET